MPTPQPNQLITESITLLNNSGFKTIADTANAPDLVGETAVSLSTTKIWTTP